MSASPVPVFHGSNALALRVASAGLALFGMVLRKAPTTFCTSRVPQSRSKLVIATFFAASTSALISVTVMSVSPVPVLVINFAIGKGGSQQLFCLGQSIFAGKAFYRMPVMGQ